MSDPTLAAAAAGTKKSDPNLDALDTSESVVSSIFGELVQEDFIKRRKAKKGEMPFAYNS